jgi:hypothetical protein
MSSRNWNSSSPGTPSTLVCTSLFARSWVGRMTGGFEDVLRTGRVGVARHSDGPVTRSAGVFQVGCGGLDAERHRIEDPLVGGQRRTEDLLLRGRPPRRRTAASPAPASRESCGGRQDPAVRVARAQATQRRPAAGHYPARQPVDVAHHRGSRGRRGQRRAIGEAMPHDRLYKQSSPLSSNSRRSSTVSLLTRKPLTTTRNRLLDIWLSLCALLLDVGSDGAAAGIPGASAPVPTRSGFHPRVAIPTAVGIGADVLGIPPGPQFPCERRSPRRRWELSCERM